MHSVVRNTFALLAVAVLAGATATPAAGQQPVLHRNVISANPFGLLLELFNAEYERVVSESATVGIGGSRFMWEDDDTSEDVEYFNADVFFRFYPQGRPLDGWAFGAKVGLTKVDEEGTFAGFGFDVNRSWLLGRNNNFYVGVGFGLKRLVGTGDSDIIDFIPTFRIVNVGFAF